MISEVPKVVQQREGTLVGHSRCRRVPPIREWDERRTHVQRELSALRAAASTRVHPDALREQFNARLKEWRGLLRQQVATGRQIVQTLLAGRIILTPLLSPPSASIR